MDPVQVAYIQSHADRPGQTGRPGECARCGGFAHLVPAHSVVSHSFTEYDAWHAKGAGLCPVCAWLYGTPELRALPVIVTQAPSFALTTRPEVYAVLAQGALRPDVAVSLPLRAGRKHVFAHAAWGMICTDNASLSWTAADACRLQAAADLRALGFTDLFLPAPPWNVLSRLQRPTWPLVISAWSSLAPWRQARPWLNLATTLINPRTERS